MLSQEKELEFGSQILFLKKQSYLPRQIGFFMVVFENINNLKYCSKSNFIFLVFIFLKKNAI